MALWTALPFTSDVTHGSNACYLKGGDVVWIQGKVLWAAPSDDRVFTKAATLPSGFRPPVDIAFIQPQAGKEGISRVSIKADGSIKIKPKQPVHLACSFHI